MAKITWKTNNQSVYGSRKREKFFWLSVANRLLFCAIIICGLGYLACANDISIKGFVLSDLKMRLAEKQKEQSDLKIASLKMQSMGEIDRRAMELKMVKVDIIDYIDSAPLGVAKK